MKVSRIIVALLLFVSCSDLEEKVSGDVEVKIFTPDLTSLVRNPLSGWTIYDDANGNVSDAATYWNLQDMVARRFSSIFYFRVRWSSLEPEEGKYAWEHDENIKALLHGALDRGLKLAFCVYVDGQDNIANATPDFVREAGAQGYSVHRLWDPEDVMNNWTPYADDPVFQEKFANFIKAFAEEFDDPDRVDYVDAFNLGWWGECHHIQYLNQTNKASVFQWITTLYGNSFKKIILVTNFGTEMGVDLEKRFAVSAQGYAIRRNGLASTWFRQTEIDQIREFFRGVPFIAEGCYWGSSDDSYQPWSEDPLYKDKFKTWEDFYKQSYEDAIRSHANTLDLRNPVESRGWTQRALSLVKDFVSYGGYRFTPLSIAYEPELKQGDMLKIKHVWKNSGVGKCPNDNRRWNYKYKVSFSLMQEGKIITQFIDEATDPSKWINGNDTEYVTQFEPELKKGKYGLYVCVADTSKEGNPPGLNLAVKKGEYSDGWLYIGNLTIR